MERLRMVVAMALLWALGCAGGPEPELFRRSPTAGYTLVIDAGSQGSRLRIYRWSRTEGEPLPQIRAAPWPRQPTDEAWSPEVMPGLSAYTDDPKAAARTIGPLVEYGLRKLGVEERGESFPSILVLATGGLRWLAAEQRQEIVTEVRRSLRRRGFDRVRVEVVSGRREALYGWLGANYVLERLVGPDAGETLGGLDLGGASAQIAFAAGTSLSPEVEEFRLGGSDYRVYVRSDLGFGQDLAEAEMADASCYPVGFASPVGKGSGDFESCLTTLVEAFRHCDAEPCPPRATQVPPLEGQFVGVANYFYTSVFFGLSSPLSLNELEAEGEEFCATDWTEIRRRHPKRPQKYLSKYCFSAAYVVALLTEGYGFPHATREVTAIDRIGGQKVAWTLGALLFELTR